MENQTENQNIDRTIIIEETPTPSNNIGLAGFILSLTSWIFFLFAPFLTCILLLLSTVLSLIGLFKKPKGFAVTGTIISCLPLLWGIVGILIIFTPMRFEKELSSRQAIVIERIKDIRTAERAFRAKYNQYTDDFSTLEWFILNDSLELNHTKVAVIDTIFSPKKLTAAQVKELRYIPFSNNKEYYLEAGIITTESKVVIPVVECRAPYKEFLDTETYHQEVVNLIDDQMNNFNRYPGVKFGSMQTGNNEVGNWEE